MKKKIYALIFVLSSSLCAAAQEENTLCPKIEVRGGEVVKPGQPMSFWVELSDEAKRFKIEYEWSASAGKILSGERDSSVAIDTTGLPNSINIKARVKVKGLPVGCSNTASDVGSTAPEIIGEPFNTYGRISLNEERAFLDAFLKELMLDPTAKGLIVIKIGTGETVEKTKKHVVKLVRHAKFRKFPVERLFFGIQKTEKRFSRLTTLWTIPEDVGLSVCERCEIINGKDF